MTTAEGTAKTSGASALAGNQHDYGTNRQQNVAHDVGMDEKYSTIGADSADAWRVNGKRTYDLHQTLDTDSILATRKHQSKLDSVELAEREQRMRHTEAEFNQRMRHADMTNAVTAALLGDMAEKLGEVYQKVVKGA